jgi:hypothetical protein
MAAGLLLGLGIYVVVWNAAVNLLVPAIYLVIRWRRFLAQMLRPAGLHIISWRKEVWGFQWRIAGTWMFRYFLEAGISPLAFQLSGPVVAGQVGMSFQMVRTIGGLANSWTATKIPFWGTLAAKKRWEELEVAWFGAAWRNVGFTGLGLGIFTAALPLVFLLIPSADERFLPQPWFGCLALGWFFYSFWLVSMHYTRALREEPYTIFHVLVGLAYLTFSLACVGWLGIATIPVAFALVHLPPSILAVLVRRRVRNRMTNPAASASS